MNFFTKINIFDLFIKVSIIFYKMSDKSMNNDNCHQTHTKNIGDQLSESSLGKNENNKYKYVPEKSSLIDNVDQRNHSNKSEESMSSYADYSEESDNPFVIFFKQRKELLMKKR